MEIHSTLVNRFGQTLPIIYRDLDSLDELKENKIKGVHAYCFCGDKLVVVYAKGKKSWGPPGGAVEPGETVEETVVREVLEETNTRVLKQKVVGYLEVFEPERTLQTRSVCIVEPFVCDPDGDITEVNLINPEDINRYFDWGENGERLLARALILKETL